MYQSPLHIVPNIEQHESQHLDLKLLRKELLLRLELSGGTTIAINEREYDRNALLQAVEKLKEHLEEHLRLFRNKPLLAFVEEGELNFFEDPEAWQDVFDPDFQRWLQPHFSQQYSHILYKCASDRSYHSINKLRTIFEGGFHLPPAYRDSCNQKTYQYFKALIKEARRKYQTPFDRKRGKKIIDRGVEDYINLHHYNVFRLLGEDFRPVIYEFGAYSRDLLVQAFPTQTKLETLTRPTLITLHNASKITLLTTKDRSITQLNSVLGRYLSSYTSQREMSWVQWARILFIVAYLAFFLISGIDSCGNGSSSRSNLDFLDPSLEQRPEDLPFALKAEELHGRWQGEVLRTDSGTILHSWVFEEDGHGQSTYTFPLMTSGETCNYAFDFTWEISSAFNNDRLFNELELSLTRPDGTGLCSQQDISPEAANLYTSLGEIAVDGRPYRQNFYLIREARSLLTRRARFHLQSNGRVYEKVGETR